ncbi:antitoxin VbhA family protein [Sphingomonas sp. ZB1N12]|uniref:antitoxin VbhA family protein n=1 Tax=Sphingomonas arabinosi TaxID=3096160 RepID=UPI002FC8C26D
MNAGPPFGASVPAISAVERARRVREVNFARGIIRYEGGVLSEEIEQLNMRYVTGEFDSDELTVAILASATVRAT